MMTGEPNRPISRRLPYALIGGALAALFAHTASAQLQNGGFTSWTTAPQSTNNNTPGTFTELGDSGGSPSVTPTLSNWSVPGTGIACVIQATAIVSYDTYLGNNSDTPTAICGQAYGGNTGSNPSYATLWATPGAFPVTGYTGNILLGDANSPTYTENISQQVSNLVSGAIYRLTFYQAAVQQAGYSLAYNDWWQVSFNTPVQSKSSTVMDDTSEGEVGWNLVTMTFISGTNNTLTFLASSSDTGTNAPPMVLLADVSLQFVPEPTTLAVLGIGLAGLAVSHRRRRRAV